MNAKIVEKELSYQTVNAAYEVHNQLGPGFLEAIYEAAMVLELESRGHQVESQVRVSVNYRGQKIGEHVLDLLVDKKIILELKAVAEIASIHQQQALSYLKATGLELAIVINFGAPSVKYTRVVNTNKKKFVFVNRKLNNLPRVWGVFGVVTPPQTPPISQLVALWLAGAKLFKLLLTITK